MSIRKIASSASSADASTHIGNKTELFYDPLGSTIRVSDGVTPGGLSIGGAISQITVHLTSANLLGCNAAPFQLLPPPGVGKMYIVESVTYYSKFNTTGYIGDEIQIWYAGSISIDLGTNGVFNSTDDEVYQSALYSTQNYDLIPVVIGENCPITLWSPNSALNGGDGTGSVTISYWILSL